MSSRKRKVGFFLFALFLIPSVGFAEENPAAQEPSSPEASVPEVPQVEPPELKPITITFSGTLEAVKAEATPPTVVILDRYGIQKEMEVLPETQIAEGATPRQLSELQAGQKLTVEYIYDVATGKRTAQSIRVGEDAQ